MMQNFSVCFGLCCLIAVVVAAPRRHQLAKKTSKQASEGVAGDQELMQMAAQMGPEEMRQILQGGGDSSKRQQLIKLIADMVKTKSGECPKSLPAEMCKQPLTFFMWLNEVRSQAKEKEMYNAIRKILVQMLAGKPVDSVAMRK